MNTPDDQDFDARLRAAVADDVPRSVDDRLRGTIARFRTRHRPSRPTHWWRWGISAAAAAIAVAAAIGLLSKPQMSLAEVADAVAVQPWVHVQTKSPNGRRFESWYSLPRQIMAFRSDDSIEYRDYRLNAYDSYDTKEKVLYRLPKYDDRNANHYAALADGMTALLQLGRTVEDPLAKLDVLGAERKGMKLVSQAVEKTTEDGHEWLDYRMIVTHPDVAEPMMLLFRVDATTKLPRLCRFGGVWNGKPTSDETYFDYPETGPAGVYALGVPKDAAVVDRVPKDDVQRILSALEIGRARMDPYRVVFVRHSDPADYSWWYDLPNIWYRQGDKFRADYTATGSGELKTDHPPADADMAAWWWKRTKVFRWYPHYVVNGDILYTSQLNKDNTAIVKVHRHKGSAFAPEWSMRPEFACRPPMGIGHEHLETRLDLAPKDGRAGCVLLSVRHTSDEGRLDKDGVGEVDENRYWLDPRRDYIVMRWDEYIRNDTSGAMELYNTTTTEEVARSPSGVWYATKIRRTPHHKTADGKPVTGDTYHIYVDFNVKFDDNWFTPPRVGKIE